jgi:hypothetical protein
MNRRIEKLANIWANLREERDGEIYYTFSDKALAVFAQQLVEEALTQVAERAYYTGDRDWSDELDRQWIQLEFGYGPLAELHK